MKTLLYNCCQPQAIRSDYVPGAVNYDAHKNLLYPFGDPTKKHTDRVQTGRWQMTFTKIVMYIIPCVLTLFSADMEQLTLFIVTSLEKRQNTTVNVRINRRQGADLGASLLGHLR